jgi:hypothetical protein
MSVDELKADELKEWHKTEKMNYKRSGSAYLYKDK